MEQHVKRSNPFEADILQALEALIARQNKQDMVCCCSAVAATLQCPVILCGPLPISCLPACLLAAHMSSNRLSRAQVCLNEKCNQAFTSCKLHELTVSSLLM